ncbi:MAG: ABC transporter permease [Bdellovibrionota bacterium]
MKGTWTICQKELKGFLGSPNFYLIAFLFTLIFSLTYSLSLSQFIRNMSAMVAAPGVPSQQMNIHYGVFLRLLSYLNLMLIFVVPALTMKLFAEEKKLRTFDLLLTSPVTSLHIVFGKFFAALGVVFVLVFLAFLYPLATATFATVQWGPLIVAYLGIFLVGAVYAAMNLFCSSLTESILIAYVASVLLNISIWLVGMGVEAVDGQTARQIFEHISLNTHLAGLVEGTIRSSAIIFLFSICALFVFLCERVVESNRWR